MNRSTIPSSWAHRLVAGTLLFGLTAAAQAAYLTTTRTGEVLVSFVSGSTSAQSSFGSGCRGAESILFTGIPQVPSATQVSLGVRPAGTVLNFWIKTAFGGTTYEAFSCDLSAPNPPDSSRVAFLNSAGNPSVDLLGIDDWRLRLDDAASFLVDNDDNDLVLRVTVVPSSTDPTPPPTVPGFPTTQPPQHPFDITRNSLFWFTHPSTSSLTCATLYQAILLNANKLPVGFLEMPTTYRSTNYVLGAEDALIEALGLYWRNVGMTGEDRGLQTLRSPASQLCRARKLLAVEIIAAIANNVLLGTGPTNAYYRTGKVVTNFPPNLIDQAGLAAYGEDRLAITVMTALLKKFNTSGTTNHFSGGLIECSPWPRAKARNYGQDPTTQLNCPGLNGSCATAEAVIYPASSDIFSAANFQRTVDTRIYPTTTYYYLSASNTVETLRQGGAPYWAIRPSVGTTNRSFTATTAGSNFGPSLYVLKGDCASLTAVTNSESVSIFSPARVRFTTDGSSTYYIRAGAGGTYTDSSGVIRDKATINGRLKIRITSP